MNKTISGKDVDKILSMFRNYREITHPIHLHIHMDTGWSSARIQLGEFSVVAPEKTLGVMYYRIG